MYVDGEDGVAAAAVVVHVVRAYHHCHHYYHHHHHHHNYNYLVNTDSSILESLLEHGHEVVQLPALDAEHGDKYFRYNNLDILDI